MGCAGSTQSQAEGSVKKIKKPKGWKHTQPITKAGLMNLREEFWDTAPLTMAVPKVTEYLFLWLALFCVF
ncbi:hypothetical protein F2Q69_00046976 [Brassica cretica]|uniref:DC-UbP/UBTD2 N-terminal domain-containing protein n=1 Tax=Brassica cretica TaxID=69181 RepID=A0A8S9PSN6_BRACR|nr:hypothetical protein F2Q69_00046976 [Brassica cretica]